MTRRIAVHGPGDTPNRPRGWWHEEDEVIRDVYPSGGPTGALQALRNVSKVERTANQVQSRAAELGVKMTHEAKSLLCKKVHRIDNRTVSGGWIPPQPRYPSIWHYAKGVAV